MLLSQAEVESDSSLHNLASQQSRGFSAAVQQIWKTLLCLASHGLNIHFLLVRIEEPLMFVQGTLSNTSQHEKLCYITEVNIKSVFSNAALSDSSVTSLDASCFSAVFC